jgi:hypothetical protein
MMVVRVPRSVGIGADDIVSMMLPRTRTFVGADSVLLLPSKP